MTAFAWQLDSNPRLDPPPLAAPAPVASVGQEVVKIASPNWGKQLSYPHSCWCYLSKGLWTSMVGNGRPLMP